MKEEKKIVLFLEKDENINEKELVAKLEEKYPKLGKALILPNNINGKASIIVFNRGIMNLTISKKSISFTFERNDKDAYELFLEITAYFDEDFDFSRLGYVTSYKHTNEERNNFLNNVFIDKKMITSDFQLSWYKEEHIDSVKVNVWERHITDLINGVEFISIFDINTPIDEKYYINFEFIENFLKKCDKFIVDRINDRF